MSSIDETVTLAAPSFTGQLLWPADPDYDAVRRVHNGLIDKHPALIARCHGVADIVDAVRLARTNGLDVSIRGGGHNVGGRATIDDGLMIDLSPMKGIHVAPRVCTVRAEGGVLWKELNRETQLFGLATTGGVVGSTGIAGLTLAILALITKLGFVVVKIDGMGTANRSKAFHDVCWHNLKDAGFPDRILWMKAAAAKYPQLDISRVGIYGTSAGGQSAAGAMLFYPEFYKAAVANCGCHDNRMDKASWNEQWMGYPVGPQYSECSNIDNAHRLRGKLFLIVGELDDNVPPESTLRFADALIKAGKDFDLLVVPGGRHGAGGAYGQRRLQDFFVRHLLGVEPPDRNSETPRSGE
jgi:dienelactone hydrolase